MHKRAGRLPEPSAAKIKSILCETGDAYVVTLKSAFSSFDDLRELKEALQPLARTTRNSGISFFVDGADHGLSQGFKGENAEVPFLDCWMEEDERLQLD